MFDVRPSSGPQHRMKATHEVTGISPQSITFPQKLNGFPARGLVLVNFGKSLMMLLLPLHVVSTTEAHLS